MKLNKISLYTILTVLAAVLIAACSPNTVTETMLAPTATPASQKITTTMGEFEIASSRLADTVRDTQAPAGSQFLLITLLGPDQKPLVPGEFSLEEFQAMIDADHKNIFVSASDGTQSAYSQMGGWLEDDFVIGFTVPIADAYTFYWPDNAPILLDPLK